MTSYARCPECAKTQATVEGDTFPEHLRWEGDERVRCPGSGWLVEDEDRVGGRWPRDP